MSTRMKWKGTPSCPGRRSVVRRWQTCSKLDAEAPLEQLDVVTKRARRLEERAVGHQQRPGEVVGEGHAGERHGVGRRQPRLLEDAVELPRQTQQADLVGDLEVPRVRRQDLREIEPPRVPVVGAHGRAGPGVRHDLDRDAFAIEQAHEARVGVGPLEAGLFTQALGGLLERGEMVLVLLQEVRDLFGGKAGRVDPRQVAAVRDLRGHGLDRLEGVAVGVVELHDRPRDRLVRGRLPQVGRRHVVGFEERVAEDFVEVGDEARLPVRRKALQLRRVELGKLEEEGCGQGPLVVLDQVQVGGRDPELLREVDLAQARAPSQSSDFGTELGLRHA